MAKSDSPTFVSGEKAVSTSGTRLAVATSQKVKSLVIIAKTGNTGQVYVGGDDITTSTNDGLAPGDSLEIPAVNWLDLADIFLDVDTNGEGVDYYAVKA